MKIKICSTQTQGNVLLVCLTIAVVLGVSLAAIFAYTTNQFVAVARSQSWNESLVTAEAGIEDGMQVINKYSNTSTPGLDWITTATADNWRIIATNWYYVRRTIDSNYYDVYIYNYNPSRPIIYSRGVKQWRTALNGNNQISRWLYVETTSGSLFQAGLLAKEGVSLMGNVVVDSYNSQNPAYSTGGQYDVTKRKDGGNVATVISNMTAAVTIGGSVDVYGKVFTGPGNTIKLTGGATVGSSNWVNGTSTGIEAGWSQSDLNVAIPDAETPVMASPSILPSKVSNTYQGTTYGNSYMLTAGDYKQTSNFSLTSTDTVLVSGNVKLWFTGDLSMTGQSKIIIGTNSSLTIYAGGEVQLTGGGAVNQTGFATNLTIYGQPSNASITYAGGSDFTGVIYAPHAAMKMTGGGSTIYNISGSVVAKSITVNGKYQVHYDESLVRKPAGPSFYLTSWREL